MERGMLLRSAPWPGSSPRSSSSLTKGVAQLVARSSRVGRPLLSQVICPFCFVCSRVLEPEGRTWHAPKRYGEDFKMGISFYSWKWPWAFKSFFWFPCLYILSSKILGFSGVSQWLLCWDQTQDLSVWANTLPTELHLQPCLCFCGFVFGGQQSGDTSLVLYYPMHQFCNWWARLLLVTN